MTNKNKLNKEYDELRLTALWAIEEMIERFEEFSPIFNNEIAKSLSKEILDKMLNDLKKNI
jgi:uncharacterized protein YfkK (UPF0435 family)